MDGDGDGDGDVAPSKEPSVAAPRSQVTTTGVAPVKKKSGLDVTPVSKDHWSSNLKKPLVTGSHVMVTVIDGKGILASNTFDGKSDPLCFLWLGPPAADMEGNDGDDAFMYTTDDEECAGLGILRTNVKYGTLEPVWNENIVFPLVLEEVNSLNKLRLILYCRDIDEDVDEATGEEVIAYKDLGMHEINLRDMIVFGKAMNEAIVDVNRTCDLKKSKNMAKNAEGSIRVTIKIMFNEADCKKLYPQVSRWSVASPSHDLPRYPKPLLTHCSTPSTHIRSAER